MDLTLSLHRHTRQLAPFFLAAGLLLGWRAGSGADLIQNGNFELPGGPIRTEPPRSPYITSWTTTDGAVSYRGDGDFDDPEGIPDGNCVELGPFWSNGAIEQAFPTATGQVYTVSFFTAADPTNGTDSALLRVSAAGSLALFLTRPPSMARTNVGWELTRFSFLSDNTGVTTLRFQNLGTNAQVSGIAMIDDVRVVAGVPLQIVSPTNATAELSQQTGLFEQVVRLTNPTASTLEAARVLVRGLPAGALVYNASGQTGGVPFVQSNLPLDPGESVELTIEYYVRDRRSLPTLELVAEVTQPRLVQNPQGVVLAPDRSLRLADGRFLVDFNTISNRTYFIEYSADLSIWNTAFPEIRGTGSRVQWLDNGPPKTDGDPRIQSSRFYRVVLVDSR